MALYDTKDSSTEFRDVIVELDSVVFTVTEVQRTLSLPGSDRLSQSVENALYHAIGICLDIITRMNERIATRRMASRGYGSIGAVAVDTWQRVGWTLFKKEELLVLRRRLSGQIEAINTLLALAQGDRMDRIGSQVDSVNAEVTSVSDAVACLREESREPYVFIREIYRCVTNLPHKLGYLWEGDPGAGDEPVIFIDILGHTVVLPWELVATEQLLHEFLVFYFRDNPCLGTVQARRYLILNLKRGQQRVSFLTWNQLWFPDPCAKKNHDYGPGSTLDMRVEINVRARRRGDTAYWTMVADRSLLDAGFLIRRMPTPGCTYISAAQLQMAFLGAGKHDETPKIPQTTERLSSYVTVEATGTMERTTHEDDNDGKAMVHFISWRFSYGVPPSNSSNRPPKGGWCPGREPPASDPCVVMAGLAVMGQHIPMEPCFLRHKTD